MVVGEPKSIVVVEDDRETAELFAEMIRIMGHQVLTAFNGAQAINLIVEKIPAAIVLDWKLPDISGLEVMKHIQRDARLAQIPIILISAINHQSNIQKGLDSGASVYLTKPVGYPELALAIKTIFPDSIDQ